jgi:hypothetical protein
MIFTIPLKEVVDSFYADKEKTDPPPKDKPGEEKGNSYRFKKVLEIISIPRGEVYK